jgi:hypothetical protein
MFYNMYPRKRITHMRVLQSFGRSRDLAIVPEPGPATRPPQTGLRNSAVVCSLEPGIWYIVEWTDNDVALHAVH